MFGFSTFNQYIGAWDTTSVTDVTEMFWYARAFNQDLGWRLATTVQATNFAHGAPCQSNSCGVRFGPAKYRYTTPYTFKDKSELVAAVDVWLSDRDEAIYQYDHISTWDVSPVTDMSELFSYATYFDASTFDDDISKWNTARVTTMSSMFEGTSAFNHDIGDWDTASVTDMSYMFAYAKAFNRDVGKWNTKSVTTMYAMFDETGAFNQDIGGWNTESVTSVKYMFSRASAFNQDLGWCFLTTVVESTGFDYLAPCDGTACGVTFGDDCSTSESNTSKGASVSIIVGVCVAAAVVLVAVLVVANKRTVTKKQPHRESSMPTVGREGDVEVPEASAA